jgi:hypothetical protein
MMVMALMMLMPVQENTHAAGKTRSDDLHGESAGEGKGQFEGIKPQSAGRRSDIAAKTRAIIGPTLAI